MSDKSLCRLEIRYLFCPVALLLALCANHQADAQSPARLSLPGQRAVVIDEGLSALRAQPDVRAAIRQRLRRGRIIGIIRTGPRYHLVQVSRSRRGWIATAAVVRSGRAEDAARLLSMLRTTSDHFTRARLARICADEFRHTAAAAGALLLLAQTAEDVSRQLTREAVRRIEKREAEKGSDGAPLNRRDYLLNDVGLDRWNRAGITFDYDARGDRIVYDGRAYQELLRKYPRAPEALTARERLARIRSGQVSADQDSLK